MAAAVLDIDNHAESSNYSVGLFNKMIYSLFIKAKVQVQICVQVAVTLGPKGMELHFV